MKPNPADSLELHKYLGQSSEWQESVLKVQSQLFSVLLHCFCRQYPEKTSQREQISRMLIFQLGTLFRDFFSLDYVKAMGPAEFERQFGSEQGLLRLLKVVKPGKSVDQILEECLNELNRKGSSLSNLDIDMVRVDVSGAIEEVCTESSQE